MISLSHEASTLFPLVCFCPIGFFTQKVLMRDVFMGSKLNHALWSSLRGSIDMKTRREEIRQKKYPDE